MNKLLAPYEDKRADAVCTFAFSMGPTSEPLIFQGRLEVRIQFEMLNIEHCTNSLHRARLFPQEVPPSLVRTMEEESRFTRFAHPKTGWEPIFEHEGETLAEMAHEKKVEDP